jgi:TrmH RNA methyltransferase
MRPEEEIVMGLRACLAVFAARRESILRVAFSPAVQDECGELLEWAHASRVPFRKLDDRALATFADSAHHEGVAIAIKPRAWLTPKSLGDHLMKTRGVAVAFDRVRNPYNVGAILRTAAFLGADGALFGPMAPMPSLSPMAVRVAEGGSEHLVLARTTDLGGSLRKLRGSGVQVLGADGRADANAFGFRYRKPTLIVMGNEREGLSPAVRAECDAIVAVPGSGHVESLNVSIAASMLLAEALRSQLTKKIEAV